MRKQIVSILLALVMAFSVLPVMAGAEETATEETTPVMETEVVEILEESEPILYEASTASEPNNSRSLANTLSNGSYVTSTVYGPGRVVNDMDGDTVDYFKFALSSKSSVSIKITSGYSNTGIAVEDSSGSTLYSSSYSFNKTVSLSAGTYYIRISCYDYASSNYTVSLSYTAESSGSDSGSGSSCPHSSYSSKTTYPDCDSGGYTTYTCRSCGYSWTDNYTDIQHEYYNTWATETEPTCTVDGVEVRYCYNCGKRQTRAIPATGHSNGDWTVTKEPTCKEEGIQTAVCSVCSETTLEEIPVTEHSFTELELTKAPSATQEGTLSVLCSFCGTAESTQTLPMLEDAQTQYVIPDGVTRIGSSAFYFRSDLTSIIIPDSVTYIGSGAFNYCSKLTSITIPDSVTYIGSSAFYNCSKLTSISIPKGITRILNSTFSVCRGLTSITIPASVTEIGSSAFSSCTSLEAVYISDLAAWCNLRFSNTDNPLYYGAKLYLNGKLLTDCVIPDGVTTIRNNAFYNYDYLTSLTIPASVTSIGSQAFANCDSLSRVTISGIPNNYYYDAFSNCKALNTLFFTGDAPRYSVYTFRGVTATAYYPAENETWTEDARNLFEGNLTWVACSHDFVGHSCTSNGVCKGCGAVKAACHDYADATCTAPKTCTYCGTTSGDALGHTEETVAPTEPTCTKNGLTEGTKCSVCDVILIEQESIPAFGHDYENGSCTVCGSSAVIRYSGKDRCLTAQKAADAMKSELGVENFDAVIYASGTNFADALAGSYLSAVKNAPILLHTASAANLESNVEYIKNNLAPGGKVYILGGTAAVSEAAETAFQEAGIQFERVKGKTRFQTNIEILKAGGFSGGKVLVCTARNFADSLSASATGLPILLVEKTWTDLNDDQKAYLADKSDLEFIIIGGTGAVSQDMEDTLRSVYGNVKRVKGKTRYETSIEVAKEFFQDPTYAILAYAENFPDGLCGGALAYAKNAPLILTKTGSITAAKGYVSGMGITSGAVLGGTKLIDDASVNAIFGAADSK